MAYAVARVSFGDADFENQMYECKQICADYFKLMHAVLS